MRRGNRRGKKGRRSRTKRSKRRWKEAQLGSAEGVNLIGG